MLMLKILYNLVNIFFRYILDFLLVVNGKVEEILWYN